MTDIDTDQDRVVVAVRHRDRIRWFRSERELWVLDLDRWRNEFIELGYDVPGFGPDVRFGLRVVDHRNADRFLELMRPFEMDAGELGRELARRFDAAASWWDVADLFPILFVDFDRRRAAAFYPDGTPMERYVPDGWEGEFIDFANEYPEEIFPASSKFWVQDGVDLLEQLNRKGAAAAGPDREPS